MKNLRVGIYGATGNVGLEAIDALLNSPYFEIAHLYASEKSAGKIYRDACKLDLSQIPDKICKMVVEPTDMKKVPEDLDIAFFALREDIAKEYELKYVSKFAENLTVVTTSSALRMSPEIPLIITEVNADHIRLAEEYRKANNSKGAPFPQCNCTAVPFAVTLKPLLSSVGIEAAFMDSYQSVSGAGANAIAKWNKEVGEREGLPKPFSVDLFELREPKVIYDGNVRPIGATNSAEEEKKVVMETLKMLGEYRDGSIIPANFFIDCMCNRVPTFKGHFEHIRIKPVKSCSEKDVVSIYNDFNEECRELYGGLQSSPLQTIRILDRSPQTRCDVGIDGGMSIVIGDIEINNGWIKIRALSDNLKKGAAKGSVQLMEYLYKKGFLKN